MSLSLMARLGCDICVTWHKAGSIWKPHREGLHLAVNISFRGKNKTQEEASAQSTLRGMLGTRRRAGQLSEHKNTPAGL